MLFLDSKKDFTTLIALGCDACEYEQEAESGYLTIIYGTREIPVKVENVCLQNSLSELDLDSIIGVNLQLTIPDSKWKELHFDVYKNNLFDLLRQNTLDGYLYLSEVFYYNDNSQQTVRIPDL